MLAVIADRAFELVDAFLQSFEVQNVVETIPL